LTNKTDNTEGFSEAWLTLREPADHAARSGLLTKQLSNWAMQQSTLHCVELGAGTGSNLRYLCPLLGHNQQWTLIDNDPTLLERLPDLIKIWAERHQICRSATDKGLFLKSEHFSARVSWIQQDLAHNLTNLSLESTQLLCASALLDLTSADWLEQLASMCIANNCATLFALNYNGHIRWNDSIEQDTLISDLLNAHQLRDKGFGDALGPQAGMYFVKQLEESGRHVVSDESNWVLDASLSALQMDLIQGWACAATEQDKSLSAVVESWSKHRLEACRARESILTVGHSDLLSLPG
jgi:hypothetical protein